MPTLNADLHCHSVVSDGTLEPEVLAARAAANGVELWALTDHDEIGGQRRAAEAARAHGMRYLTGTEISVTFAHETVHNPDAAETLFANFTIESLNDPDPPRWSYVIFDSHPSVKERIAMAEAWRQRR